MIRTIRKTLATKGDEGASAVEYGLLVAAIAAVIVVIVFALGGVIKDVFQETCDEIKAGATIASTNNCS
jgi:pilus assembly protein Flp/PilA